MTPRRSPLVPLLDRLAELGWSRSEAESLVDARRVVVDGRYITNAAARVRQDSAVVVRKPPVLRGEAKLQSAFETWQLDVNGRVALDLGASTGGFTRVLLDRGAARVYAVDAGYGQLLGSLRQDPRVVN